LAAYPLPWRRIGIAADLANLSFSFIAFSIFAQQDRISVLPLGVDGATFRRCFATDRSHF
jgi:hypothetical protein